MDCVWSIVEVEIIFEPSPLLSVCQFYESLEPISLVLAEIKSVLIFVYFPLIFSCRCPNCRLCSWSDWTSCGLCESGVSFWHDGLNPFRETPQSHPTIPKTKTFCNGDSRWVYKREATEQQAKFCGGAHWNTSDWRSKPLPNGRPGLWSTDGESYSWIYCIVVDNQPFWMGLCCLKIYQILLSLLLPTVFVHMLTSYLV